MAIRDIGKIEEDIKAVEAEKRKREHLKVFDLISRIYYHEDMARLLREVRSSGGNRSTYTPPKLDD